jgi:hypothetical protein
VALSARTFFRLAQDTAVFDESTTAALTQALNLTIPYAGSVDMSARTSALNLNILTHLIFMAAIGRLVLALTIRASTAITFSGRNTQVITSAGKTFSGGITVNSFGGTVELADALNMVEHDTLTVTNGTFDTKGYNVTAGTLSSSYSTVREIKLGASTVTLSGQPGVTFATSTNLTFDAGTSSIVQTSASGSLTGGGQTFYDVSLHITTAGTSHHQPIQHLQQPVDHGSFFCWPAPSGSYWQTKPSQAP